MTGGVAAPGPEARRPTLKARRACVCNTRRTPFPSRGSFFRERVGNECSSSRFPASNSPVDTADRERQYVHRVVHDCCRRSFVQTAPPRDHPVLGQRLRRLRGTDDPQQESAARNPRMARPAACSSWSSLCSAITIPHRPAGGLYCYKWRSAHGHTQRILVT